MARLHTGIIALCLLSAFASPAYAETPKKNPSMLCIVIFTIADKTPDCLINTNAAPFERFIRSYPTSGRIRQVASVAADNYQQAANLYQQRGATVQAQNAAARAGELRAFVAGTGSLPAYLKAEQPPKTPPQPNEAESLRAAAARQGLSQPEAAAVPQQTYEEWQRRMYAQSSQQPTQPTVATQQTAPPQSSTAPPTDISTLGMLLLVFISVAYPILYALSCNVIVGLAPRIWDVVILSFEAFACILVTVFLHLLTQSVAVLASLLAVYLAIRLVVEIGRVATRRDAEKARAREEQLKMQKETVTAFIPLLNAVNATYGRYHTNPDLIPAAWYEPRKHFIDDMADSLYSVHTRNDTYAFRASGITPESHSLSILHTLPYIVTESSNIPETYEVLTKIVRNPSDPAYIVFRDLIPRDVDLLPYLKEERWRERLARQAQELETLVTQEITKQHTVIGTPPDDLPIAYNSLESRYRHTFLIGRSGAGKSTVITNLVAQDIHKGHGVIVMSPDQDLMSRIVPYIPEHRLDDVIYFDPSDTTSPIIGFNPFFFERSENPVENQLLKNRKAGETYTVLERTLGLSTQEGMQTLLNNAMHGLIGRPTASINELRRLLDPKERALHREVANNPELDDYTREYWETYATEGANALVYRNLIRRMANLLRPPLFHIFSTQSFSFHREINEHARILLIDLSGFSRDSMEAKITAQLLIATIQQTMLRRDKMPKSAYIPYFMYIDEFRNFADTNEKSIGDMTEQLRKYSFGLTLTSLVASDLSSRLFDTIIGVMSTFICLSISAKDAGRFASEMSVKRSDRDSFNPEALPKLQRGQAYVLTPPLQSAVFVNLPEYPPGNLPKLSTTIAELKRRSQANFGAIAKPAAAAAIVADITQADRAEPTESPQPTPKPKPKSTRRRGRNRFDDDAGDPLIEVS